MRGWNCPLLCLWEGCPFVLAFIFLGGFCLNNHVGLPVFRKPGKMGGGFPFSFPLNPPETGYHQKRRHPFGGQVGECDSAETLAGHKWGLGHWVSFGRGKLNVQIAPSNPLQNNNKTILRGIMTEKIGSLPPSILKGYQGTREKVSFQKQLLWPQVACL